MKFKRLTAALCALAVVVSSAGGLPFSGVSLFDTAIVASAAEYNDVTSFNSATEADPVLKLTQNVGEIYITRADGTVDLNGHTVTNLFLQNKDPNKTVTVKNGTINNKIDGRTGFDADFAGKVVLENLTVKGNTWADGHTITIKSGTYNAIQNSTNFSTSAKSSVIIEGGSFNNLVIGTKGESYSISGGSFKTKPNEDFLAEGVTFILNEAGQYVALVVVSDVTLNKESLKLTEGEDETLTATVNPDDATYKTVTWSSSNTSVATVDANGKVTAVAPGTATITATATNGTGDTADDKTATCAVTVNKAQIDPVYTITIPESVNIDGGKAEFKAENVTLPDGAKINITVDGENTESGQTTFNAKNEAGNSTVSYTIKNGSADVADGGIALTFTEGGTQTLTFAKKADSTPTYAGKHTETLTFGIAVESAKAAAEKPDIAQADCKFSPSNGTSTLSNANITTAMEYSSDNGTTWTDVTSAGSIASLAAGTVQIRVKETADKLASEAVSITVPQVLKINELVGPYTGDRLTCEYYAGETWQALVNRYNLIKAYSGRAAFGSDGFIYYKGSMIPVTDLIDNSKTYEVQ